MTPKELQEILRFPYSRERWLDILHKQLPATEVFKGAQPRSLTDPSVVSAVQIARIPLADDRVVAVLEVKVSGRVDLAKNRKGLRDLIARFIDQQQAHAVLGLFQGENADYRFSFVARTSEIGADGQLSRSETAPRRYTYLLGPGQACRTPAERLDSLKHHGRRATLDDLLKAFSVEPLFKEFYRDYRLTFEQVEALIRPSLPDDEALRLFTQRLFNRLLFIAFLQRKEWLRFNSRTDYLAALWEDYGRAKPAESRAANFYRDRLEHLFFSALNNSAERNLIGINRGGFLGKLVGEVPYLNGGLFDKDQADIPAGLSVPDKALAAILDAENGLFSRYNFTVAESTPLEIDVAVDPEMLGKVFEELVTGRHEQGSYYTPKPIVSFMGRAALVEYLAYRCPKESRPSLEEFVHDHKPGGLRDAERVLVALRDVKVCDPACGSGAYLLGMLHELIDLRTCLFATVQKLDAPTTHERKLEIIERSLYGVDLDPFAVNIARLRLWLSLAVDFEGPVPPPLPNLDFKIEQGDALAAPAPATLLGDTSALRDQVIDEFRQKKAEYLRAHGNEKVTLRAEIDRLRSDLRTWLNSDAPANAFDWAIEFAEVFLPTTAVAGLGGELNLGHELAAAPEPGGFDIVVANPPYVRMELIKPQKPVLRRRFPHVHAERADLYVYFYARAQELLRPHGVAAFISSNKWLRAGYGESLRQHLLDQQAFRLVMDFGDLPVFESASAYPCIFLWRKEPRGSTDTLWANVKDLAGCYTEGVREHFLRINLSVPASQFVSGGPRLTATAAAGQQQVMDRAGPRLKNVPGLSIIYGLKTGLNEAFVLTAKERQDLVDEDGSSDEVIKPLLFGANIRRYCISPAGEYIIYTPHGLNIEEYPAIARHLSKFRKLPVSLGKKPRGLDYRATSQKWFELQQAQEAYVPRFLGPKVVYPDITREARFAFDDAGYFLETTCFAVANADYYILAVLNSASAWWYLTNCVAHIRGGFLRFKAQYLEAIPIPVASDVERSSVAALAKQAQDLHRLRRTLVEQFLVNLGVDPSQSTSRNPLEQPWTLSALEFGKRTKKQPLKLYEDARDETATLTEQITKVESEIDARVALLYGLDAEDQRWASQVSSAKPNDKEVIFFSVLGRLKEGHAYFRYERIQTLVEDAELKIDNAALRVYLSEAVKRGLIHDAGRGWYSRLSEPVPLDPKSVAKLVAALTKALPLLDFSCWSTAQINPWMHHLLAQPVAFLYASGDALESVGETLAGLGWKVAVDPKASEAADLVRPGPKMVVLRPSRSKQPEGADHQAPIEKILVDLVEEAGDSALMDASEAQGVIKTALSRYLLQIASLQSYAERRGIKPEALGLIN